MATLGELVTDAAAAIIAVSMKCGWYADSVPRPRLPLDTTRQLTSGSVLAMIHDGLVIFIMVDAGYRN